jgi:phage terminase Nu1 subunit (DNA packaging protein)
MNDDDKAGARSGVPAEGESNVVQLRPDSELVVTKKQLAALLGRSVRWIEQKQAEGMPVRDLTDRMGRRTYVVGDVEKWLSEGKPRPPRDRVSELRRDVDQLKSEVAEINKTLNLKGGDG